MSPDAQGLSAQAQTRCDHAGHPRSEGHLLVAERHLLSAELLHPKGAHEPSNGCFSSQALVQESATLCSQVPGKGRVHV